ncbi:hypothetical protein JCM15765_18340 [Paradesulfitobacterium aromaticivorans]
MSLDKAISQVNFEIQQIDELLISYKDLFENSLVKEPSLIELTAIGSVLHSFYNGVENIFESIGKNIDGRLPTGNHWHIELLKQMTQDTHKRPPVISEGLKGRLTEYLAFRHFYRNSYSFFLKWDELKKLVNPIESIWAECKNELTTFFNRNI